MNLAPIGLSVYSRLSHIRKTVQALASNTLASHSEIYVFSDGPRKSDEAKVAAVRNYFQTVKGFNNLHLLERNQNSRTANNRDGIRFLLDKYGKMIYLEEDTVTAPNFLEYMNNALEFYRNDFRIISINGYSPPVNPPKFYDYDIYLSPRFSAWGFGIWKDRYDTIKLRIDGYEDLLRNKRALKSIRMLGEDFLELLKSEMDGKIDALDVKIIYQQFLQNKYSVSPTRSLVQNTGHDGTGIHCKKTKRFDVKLDINAPSLELIRDIQPNSAYLKKLYRFRSGGIKGKFDRCLKCSGLFPFAASIRNYFHGY